MIISGGARKNWRFFTKHLTNTKENDRAELVEVRGLAADNVREAFRQMDAVASGTRCENFFYHANINPRDDEHLTPEQWETAVNTLEKNLGLEGHSRFVVEHEKNGRTHRHVIWSRIDPDSMTAVSDSNDFRQHQRTSRELEALFGHEPVRNARELDGKDKGKERRPKSWETFRGKKSGLDPAQVKAEITAIWRETETGAAFHDGLAKQGYILCKGDKRDFCVVDQAGQEHSLARRIEGAKATDIRARLADMDSAALPSVSEARAASSAWNEKADTEGHRRVRQAEAKKLAREYRQAQRRVREALKGQSLRDMNRAARTEAIIGTAELTQGYTNREFFERMEAARERAIQIREASNQGGLTPEAAAAEKRRVELIKLASTYVETARKSGDIGPASTWSTRMRGYLDRTAKVPQPEPAKATSWRNRVTMEGPKRGPEMER